MPLVEVQTAEQLSIEVAVGGCLEESSMRLGQETGVDGERASWIAMQRAGELLRKGHGDVERGCMELKQPTGIIGRTATYARERRVAVPSMCVDRISGVWIEAYSGTV